MDLRPSSAHIWTKCFGSPLMSSMVPDEPTTDPAREGTCAAWVAEMVLTGAVPSCRDMIGRTHTNGWLVEPDMAAHIERYVSLVRSRGGEIHTERKVRLNRYIAGTPDSYAVLAADGVLYVDDLKYGFDIVEPYQNPQVCIYAGAILRRVNSHGVTIRRVSIGIYQPRAWHIAGVHRTWVVHPETLMSYVHTIEAAGEECQNPAPTLVPGDHCRYCPAAATCHACASANYAVFGAVQMMGQRHMTAVEMAAELDFLERAEGALSGRIRAVRAEAEARMARGEHVPGWHMEQRAGQRRFRFDAATVHAMTGLSAIEEKIVTPAEMERRGASPEVVAALVETPRTKPRLSRIPPNYYANLFKGR